MTPGNLPPGMDVPSPCTNVCTIDPVTGLCVGCLRTLDEIARWSVLDAEAKRAVWAELAIRRADVAAGANHPRRTETDAEP
jgi:predicted Fe-S protein YdhL (DUF1289 family)